ncbi:MAG: hypothetical protein ACLRPW_06290 [Intestinibacter sp.]
MKEIKIKVRTRNLVTSALLAAIICLVTGIYFIPTPNGGYAHIEMQLYI